MSEAAAWLPSEGTTKTCFIVFAFFEWTWSTQDGVFWKISWYLRTTFEKKKHLQTVETIKEIRRLSSTELLTFWRETQFEPCEHTLRALKWEIFSQGIGIGRPQQKENEVRQGLGLTRWKYFSWKTSRYKSSQQVVLFSLSPVLFTVSTSCWYKCVCVCNLFVLLFQQFSKSLFSRF